jgi:hypothetical protein
MARTKQTPTDKKLSNQMNNVNKAARNRETKRQSLTRGRVTGRRDPTPENSDSEEGVSRLFKNTFYFLPFYSFYL